MPDTKLNSLPITFKVVGMNSYLELSSKSYYNAISNPKTQYSITLRPLAYGAYYPSSNELVLPVGEEIFKSLHLGTEFVLNPSPLTQESASPAQVKAACDLLKEMMQKPLKETGQWFTVGEIPTESVWCEKSERICTKNTCVCPSMEKMDKL